jgi:hypothetical protein
MSLIGSNGPASPAQWTGIGAGFDPKDVFVGLCTACRNVTIWKGAVMVYPAVQDFGPAPAHDMPEDIKADFNEARAIAARSPRGATALLRLGVQKLCKALGERGENINHDIGKLVARGLDAGIQEALDSVRVLGNSAVHPGEIDLKDDLQTAESLMELVNYIVDAMITQPKKRQALYARLPATAQAAIEKRDVKTP